MGTVKEPKTYEEQLDILCERGIVVKDKAKCIQVLETTNYYRFTAYLLPFKLEDDTYISGTDFYKVYRIYEFDRKLRGLLFSVIEEIEVFLRAKFAYFHAHKYGACGYLDANNFSPKHKLEKFKENFDREVRNNKNTLFVRHYTQKYNKIFPIWVAVELFTFGMLSKFYGDLKTPDQKILAYEMYHTNPKNMNSWLRCCTDLRNICAHYGRLYYRVFSACPAGLAITEAQKRRLWGAILSLFHLYHDNNKWNSEYLPSLIALFKEYEDDISLYHLAFPENWIEHLTK